MTTPTSNLTAAETANLLRAVTPILRPLLARRRAAPAIGNLLREITDAIAADVAAPQERNGFSGPFNGQRQRQALFNRLDAMFGFGSFIETGAHVGTTTEMLAGLDRPVHSCELNRRIYLRAAVRLASYANVTLANTDSRSFLSALLAAPPPGPHFCYLDAHWNDDLPLPQEIDLIAGALPHFVIFADDFQHPDPGYGFDRYANGNELTLDFLLPRLTCQRRLAFLAPSAAAASESGAKRGTLVVVPADSYEAALADEPLLQLLTVREN